VRTPRKSSGSKKPRMSSADSFRSLFARKSPDFVGGANPSEVRKIYQFGNTIGTGGYAVVKEAMHRKEGKAYAVKIMRPDSNKEDRGGLTPEDIIAEIEILKGLDHPSIIQMKEYFLGSRGQVFIVTELLRGGELLDAMLNIGTYTEAEARVVLRQVLNGLAYLHSRGVTHRDLKLENLLLAKKNDITTVRIADFGLAKALMKSRVMETTCGSPMYVAPEVIAGKRYTPAVDMWSTGVILYILLAGAPPFDVVDNEPLLFRRIMEGDYSLDTEEWASISEPAKDLVKKLMNLVPKDRPDADAALNHPWMTMAEEELREQPTAQGAKDALKAYAAKMKLPEKKFLPGEFLVRQGDKAAEVFLIRKGSCEVLLDGQEDPNELVKVAERREGDFIGEMAVAWEEFEEADEDEVENAGRDAKKPLPRKSTSRRRTASVRAVDTVTAVILGKKEMQWVLDHDSAVQEEIKIAVNQRRQELKDAKKS